MSQSFDFSRITEMQKKFIDEQRERDEQRLSQLRRETTYRNKSRKLQLPWYQSEWLPQYLLAIPFFSYIPQGQRHRLYRAARTSPTHSDFHQLAYFALYACVRGENSSGLRSITSWLFMRSLFDLESQFLTPARLNEAFDVLRFSQQIIKEGISPTFLQTFYGRLRAHLIQQITNSSDQAFHDRVLKAIFRRRFTFISSFNYRAADIINTLQPSESALIKLYNDVVYGDILSEIHNDAHLASQVFTNPSDKRRERCESAARDIASFLVEHLGIELFKANRSSFLMLKLRGLYHMASSHEANSLYGLSGVPKDNAQTEPAGEGGEQKELNSRQSIFEQIFGS